MVKKSDILLIASIFLVCVVLAIFTLKGSSAENIKVTVGGKEYATYSLNTDGEYIIKTENGQNTLIIKNNSAHFINSDCPDKTCENMGAIKNPGESIVCLPHRVIAEVVK